MKIIIEILSERFEKAVYDAFPQLKAEKIPLEVTSSTQEQFGHYQCNSAMKLAKLLKMSPRAIAEKIVKSFDRSWQDLPLVEKMEIAGPGFINVTLDAAFLNASINKIFLDDHFGIDLPAHKHKVIVDFSSPNIAKEMHVGHLRSTIIGDCLARLFEFLGHDVLRLNHLGDWGTAFGMLIAYMKEEAPKVLTGEEETDLTKLVTWYKASKARFDLDSDFKRRSQLEVVALQGGDPEARKAWEIICKISEKAYKEIYDLLGVTLTSRGESFYNAMLPKVVEDLKEKGLLKESEGAKCLFPKGFVNRDGDPFPLMMQKSDGGYTYDTTDMAAVLHRTKEEGAERLIYVTDSGQGQHFQMIFEAAREAAYLDPEKVRTDHVPFGLVLGPDGRKFRTRSGETEKLIDLLYAAIDRAGKILAEREPELDEEERKRVAHVLGISAVKYADLSCNRTGDYTFSYDRMLRFEGNTAAFLMYSYVRIAGIKRKVGVDVDAVKTNNTISLEHSSEIALGLHIIRFGEALREVENELLPNRLTEYLYALAEKFNHFHRDCRVIGSDKQGSRLLLCDVTAKVMKQGLHLLGVETVERM